MRTWAQAQILAVCAGLALFLTACGFEPMYGARSAGSSAAAALATVELAPILDKEQQPYRLGQQLEMLLNERLGSAGMSLYRLELSLDRERDGFGTRQDSAVTRYGLRLTAYYRLIELASGNTVLEERTHSYNSYDVEKSDFATLTAERDMELRLIKDLSERVAGRLSLYFRDHGTTSAVPAESQP